MIAPEHDGHGPLAQDPVHLVAHDLAGVPDLRQVLQARVAGVARLLDEDVDVPAVRHFVAERAHAGMDLRHPERGRAHVHTAAAGAQVQGTPMNVIFFAAMRCDASTRLRGQLTRCPDFSVKVGLMGAPPTQARPLRPAP